MISKRLWDTVINQKTRELLRIEVGDEMRADEIFAKLMGDQV